MKGPALFEPTPDGGQGTPLDFGLKKQRGPRGGPLQHSGYTGFGWRPPKKLAGTLGGVAEGKSEGFPMVNRPPNISTRVLIFGGVYPSPPALLPTARHM